MTALGSVSLALFYRVSSTKTSGLINSKKPGDSRDSREAKGTDQYLSGERDW